MALEQVQSVIARAWEAGYFKDCCCWTPRGTPRKAGNLRRRLYPAARRLLATEGEWRSNGWELVNRTLGIAVQLAEFFSPAMVDEGGGSCPLQVVQWTA